MAVVVVDFETFYAKDYTLSKMTTEAYVRDPRFHAHSIGVKVDDQPTYYVPDTDDIAEHLRSLELHKHALVCHNAYFDGLILSHHYGIHPKFWCDTMLMGKALYHHESASLAKLSELLGIGEKGKELANFLGVERLTPLQHNMMRGYCINDVDLTYQLFNLMKTRVPRDELKLIDLTIRMMTDPKITLDGDLLRGHLAGVLDRKQKLLDSVSKEQTALRSNQQFAQLLIDRGVEPPTKISPTTGKLTYAFSKTDEAMKALLDHHDEEVQLLAAARLGVKSSIEETRTQTFIGISERGPLPVHLIYCGAGNSTRWSASSYNLQNLPRGGALRKSMMAPEGKKLVVCDLSAIEARVLACLAGQDDLVDQFRTGADVYCEFSAKLFNREITKKDKLERQLGKLAILGLGYGMGWPKMATLLLLGPLGAPPILFDDDMTAAMGGDVQEFAGSTKNTRRMEGVSSILQLDTLLPHCAGAKRLVDVYREANAKIVLYWRTGERMLESMMMGDVEQYGLFTTGKDKISLPSGLDLQYPGLRPSSEGKGTFTYYGRGGQGVHIRGAKLVENLVQATSRCVMAGQMIEVSKKYPIILTVHDEIVILADEDDDQALPYIEQVMNTAPAWAPDWPIAAEGSEAKRYGDAK